MKRQEEKIRKEVLAVFEGKIKLKDQTVMLYKKFGINSPFIRGIFIEFIDQNFPNIVKNFINFEDYICSEIE